MSLRVWGGLALGLMMLAAASCWQSGEPAASETEAPRLEIDRPDTFWADPKVIQSCDDLLGQTTLHWKADGVSTVEVRVDRPDGPLFAMAGPVGSADTGHWVRDNMIFYLLNPNTGEVLASCTVRVTSAGCPEGEPAAPAPAADTAPDAP
ncbi:MAG: hypothetical protein WAO20_17830 [Acidobacteriota bacterium]